MDTIANMLTIIRNGYLARKQSVEIPYYRLNEDIAKKLVQLEFLDSINVEQSKDKKKILKTVLLYKDNKPSLEGIERVSKQSVRVYTSFSKTPKVLGGLGEVIISTSKGVLVGAEAKKNKVGGELLLKVW